MKKLTCLELYEIIKKHDFILARTRNGYQVAFNCKAAEIAKRVSFKPTRETAFVSYRPCSFMEYISKKEGFLKPSTF